MVERLLPLTPDYLYALDEIAISLLDNVSINLVIVKSSLSGLTALA